MPLDAETIERLLTSAAPVKKATTGVGIRERRPSLGYPPVEQYGPLRWFNTEMRCASRGCSSPTYCKVEGIPRCQMHALFALNTMLIADDDGRLL